MSQLAMCLKFHDKFAQTQQLTPTVHINAKFDENNKNSARLRNCFNLTVK
jgi:hypothetical protein